MKKDKELYASLPRRIKAGLIDGLIVLSLFIVLPIAISSIFSNESAIVPLLMYSPILILEPFLISFYGATIGQYIFGIEVVKNSTYSKCPLLISFVRYYTKIVLGSLSVIYMLFSQRHQAIHDHFAGTIVIMSRKRIQAKPDFASQGEREQYSDSEYKYPSAIRRFVFFLLWFILTSFVVGIIFEIGSITLIPNYTLETESYPESIEIAMNVVGAILFFLLAFLGSKGFLFGARKIKTPVN